MARLAEVPDGILVAALQKRDVSAAVLNGLAKRGLVVIEDEVIDRDPFVDDELAKAAGQLAQNCQNQAGMTFGAPAVGAGAENSADVLWR